MYIYVVVDYKIPKIKRWGRNRNPPGSLGGPAPPFSLTYPLYHLSTSLQSRPSNLFSSSWSTMSQEVTRAESIEEQGRAREDGDKKPKSRRPASRSLGDLINPLSSTNLFVPDTAFRQQRLKAWQ